MRTLAELATRAADLIEAAPEKEWAQGAYARTRAGQIVGSDSTIAVCWCAVGFLYREKVPVGTFAQPIVRANDGATDRADAIARLRALAAAVPS